MTAPPIPLPASAELGEVAGRPVVLRFGEVGAEYDALRSGAMVVDRSHRGRMRVSGPKAREVVTGLVTNDVLALAAGQGMYAAALTPKGKIVADVRVFAEEGALLVDTPPRAFDGWMGLVRKYVNPRLAPYRDETAALGAVGLFGAQARRIVSAVTGVAAPALAALAPYAHLAAAAEGGPAVVARVPDLGLEGYELWVPADALVPLWAASMRQGATPAGLAAWEIARVEAGRPEWGVDIDDTTIPQEANFDELHAISYTKGCYVGQETVARVHFRGHVNRHLRGLRFVPPELPRAASQLADGTGKVVGDVRSTAVSPRLGGIALAMVRREVEPGASLVARWDGGECRAEVVRLPFPL